MTMRVLPAVAILLVAQAAAPHVRRDVRFESAALKRDVPYRVLLPADYESSRRRYPVLYLLHGLDGNHTNWAERTRLAEYAAGRSLIIVTPEGANSWYINWNEGASERWEDYIVRDLIAEIDARYRTVPARDGRYIAGLSMGGYGAIRIALKYPQLFALAGSFSGPFHIARLETYGWNDGLRAEFAKAFGPAGGAHRASNDLLISVRDANARLQPLLYFDCGTEDPFLAANREFAQALRDAGFAYVYREYPGAHDWAYWDQRIAEFVRRFGD